MTFSGPLHEWGGGTSASATTLTVTIPSGQGASVGNLVWLGAGCSNARTLSSVTDSKGNTWTVGSRQQAGGTNINAAFAYCVPTTALVAGDTITLTWSGSGSSAAGFLEFSGQAASSLVDQVGSVFSAGSSSSATYNAVTDGNLDTTDELVLVSWAFNGSNNGTAGTGFTMATRQASTGTIRSQQNEYKTASGASGSGQTAPITINVSTSGHIAGVIATFRPATGLTAVGKDLQLIWDTRAAVPDTLQLVWHTRAAVSKDLQLIWGVRTAVAQTLQLIWAVRQAVGPSLQLLWHTRVAVAKTLQLLWHARAIIGNDLQLAWAIRQAVADTLSLLWGTRAPASDDLQLSWDTRAAVSDDLALLWHTRAAVSDELALVWAVREAVADTLPLLWHTRQVVGADLALLWDTDELVIPGVVGVELALLWAVRENVGQDLALAWDVRQSASDTLQLLWQTRAPAGADLQLSWHARASVGQSLALAWATRQAVADELGLSWAVRRAVGADLALSWDTESHLIDLPPATRVAVRWLGSASPGRVGLAPAYRLRWGKPGAVRSDDA